MNITHLSIPDADIAVRVGVEVDLPAIDALQRANSKALGFMPRGTLVGKMIRGELLVAEDASGAFVGYVVGGDRYHKREDVGVVYQLAVVPGRRRGAVGATLLKKMFERWARGCRLCCCWCAQDLEANRFWEALGFVPLAYRAGSSGKKRVHIFWQRRVDAGDERTPWWFPSATGGGAIREDRVVLPIPLGQHWSAARPIVLPRSEQPALPAVEEVEVEKDGVRQYADGVEERDGELWRGGKRLKTIDEVRPKTDLGGMWFMPEDVEIVKEKPKPLRKRRKAKPAKARATNDPALVAFVRDLRDAWLEEVNARGDLSADAGRYDVSRLPPPRRSVGELPGGGSARLLSAA